MCNFSLLFSRHDFPYAGIRLWKLSPMIVEDRVSLWCETSACRALPKNFYARLLSDIIGYTVSLADMRKKWKPVDKNRTRNLNEHYPTLYMHAIPACYRQLPWLYIWITIRNSIQLSQGPWESHVYSCEQSVVTALLMSSITMKDAQTGQGEIWTDWRKGNGCNSHQRS